MSLLMSDPPPPLHIFGDVNIVARFVYYVDGRVYDFVKIEFTPTEHTNLEITARELLKQKTREMGNYLFNHCVYEKMKLESLIIEKRKQ